MFVGWDFYLPSMPSRTSPEPHMTTICEYDSYALLWIQLRENINYVAPTLSKSDGDEPKDTLANNKLNFNNFSTK